MDPNRDFYRLSFHAGMGMAQAFVPTGLVGILAGMIILGLLGIVVGLFQGLWLIGTIAVLVALAPITFLAFKQEMRRDDVSRAPERASSLPPDADLPDEERRDAMRRYGRDLDDGG